MRTANEVATAYYQGNPRAVTTQGIKEELDTIKKIAFVGDSFCMNVFPKTQDHPEQECWPLTVAETFNAEIIQSGNGGQHFYHAIMDFMLNVLDADVTIICVSEPYRVINRHNLPVNQVFVEQMLSKTGHHWEHHHQFADQIGMSTNEMVEVAEAAEGYYKHLFDENVVEFLQVGLISFIDGLMKSLDKKVIWFPCFQMSFSLPKEYWESPDGDTNRFYNKITNAIYIPTSGPSANMAIFDISMIELDQEGYNAKEKEYVSKNDHRMNHLSNESNIHMAKLIIDVIRSNNFTPRELKLEEYFSQLTLNEVKRMR